jgi:multidrug efflux pump subunit AcrA (membrane-fusion protein)
LEVAASEARRLQALVGYLNLPAPFDGIITGRNANTLDFVLPATGDPSSDTHAPHLSPNGAAAPVYVVERTDVVRVFVDIPEREAKYVLPGTEATVLIEAFDDDPISASVTRISWALNVRSRTLRAEIDLPNSGSKLIPENIPEAVQKSLARVKLPDTSGQILPGMYAYGNVVIERQGVWALPKSVLDYRDGKTFYWTCQNNHAQRVEVQTGVSDSDWIEIVKRRAMGTHLESWKSFDSSLAAIESDDVSGLAEGTSVRIASEVEKLAAPAGGGNPSNRKSETF